jgi:heme-degrading monooxygenase HmoA
MVIVAGHVTVAAARVLPRGLREHRRTGTRGSRLPRLRHHRRPDRRVNILERWESRAAVKSFRKRGPRNKSGAAMRSASVAEYDIADVRPLFGKGTA